MNFLIDSKIIYLMTIESTNLVITNIYTYICPKIRALKNTKSYLKIKIKKQLDKNLTTFENLLS